MRASFPGSAFVDAGRAFRGTARRPTGVSEREVQAECRQVCVAGDEVQLWAVGGAGDFVGEG